jgi:hypothetical protein
VERDVQVVVYPPGGEARALALEELPWIRRVGRDRRDTDSRPFRSSESLSSVVVSLVVVDGVDHDAQLEIC